jgi:hypothetical protein
MPERALSDTVAAPAAAGLLDGAAAGLLDAAAAAGLLDAAAAAGLLDGAGLDVAVLVVVLEPLEQAAAIRLIPATPTALAIHLVMVMLPWRHLARLCPRLSVPRPRPPAGDGVLPYS